MTIPVALRPKLSALAKQQNCTVRSLVIVAVEELIAAFDDAAAHTAAKVQPGERLMDARRRIDAESHDVIWNGAMGKDGKSLSSFDRV